MSSISCLLVAVGQFDLPRRMVMLCDTGATHNIISEWVVRKLREHGVTFKTIPKRLERLRSLHDSAFYLSEAIQLSITIGAYTCPIDFHVAAEVVVNMIVGYPQMRRYNWKMDLENHALEIRGTKYSFSTHDDFSRLSLAHGVRTCLPVPTCAWVSVLIPPNKTAYVSVDFANTVDGTVLFEPAPAFIARYQLYPCPGIFDAAWPSVIRLLNANADQALQVMVGMTFGAARPVRRITEAFYCEFDTNVVEEEDPDLVDGSEIAPVANDGSSGSCFVSNSTKRRCFSVIP